MWTIRSTGLSLAAAGLFAALAAPTSSAPGRKAGNPETELPSNVAPLTGFGERAAWSPDDRRIAFMSKSFGDAFEIDLASRRIRLLTGHFPHPGFLRVQYLPSGDFFLIGARTFTDIRTTRSRDQEMWVLKADASAPPMSLGHKISEGVAISRRAMRIAWSNTHGQYPDAIPEGESVLYTGDIIYKDGAAALADKKEVLRARRPRGLEPGGQRRRQAHRVPVRAQQRARGRGTWHLHPHASLRRETPARGRHERAVFAAARP